MTDDDIDVRYPLHWPEGYPRTKYQEYSRFKMPQHAAQEKLIHELELLGAFNVRLSTNIKLRNDGLPYASQPRVEDTGVAVYFDLAGEPRVLACDAWMRIGENMQAIAKTVEAMRGIERWGCTDMLDRMFRGFEALPMLDDDPWYVVLGMDKAAPTPAVEKAFRVLRSRHHPDHGGSEDQFDRVQKALEQFRESRGLV